MVVIYLVQLVIRNVIETYLVVHWLGRRRSDSRSSGWRLAVRVVARRHVQQRSDCVSSVGPSSVAEEDMLCEWFVGYDVVGGGGSLCCC